MNVNGYTDVIIIGGNHHNTLGVIRALGNKVAKDKIHLILHGDKRSPITRTKYLQNNNIHYIKDCAQITAVILNIVNVIATKPVVICCGDMYISAIDQNFDKLNDYCTLPNANGKAGRINYFLCKEQQSEAAASAGLKSPDHFIIDTKDILLSPCLPCIIKPENSTKGGKSDIEICRTLDEISQYIQCHDGTNRVIVEKFIDKQYEFQLIGCSLKNDIIIPGYTHIIRQPKTTNTGYLQYNPIHDGFISAALLNKVKTFIRHIGYQGLFSVEFLRDKQGIDYFLEINMRNDGNAFCVTCAGVNLPYIWYKYADKKEYVITEPIQFEKPVLWMPEADARNIKSVGLLRWLNQWKNADGHGIANLIDPFPIIYYVLSKFKARIFK